MSSLKKIGGEYEKAAQVAPFVSPLSLKAVPSSRTSRRQPCAIGGCSDNSARPRASSPNNRDFFSDNGLSPQTSRIEVELMNLLIEKEIQELQVELKRLEENLHACSPEPLPDSERGCSTDDAQEQFSGSMSQIRHKKLSASLPPSRFFQGSPSNFLQEDLHLGASLRSRNKQIQLCSPLQIPEKKLEGYAVPPSNFNRRQALPSTLENAFVTENHCQIQQGNRVDRAVNPPLPKNDYITKRNLRKLSQNKVPQAPQFINELPVGFANQHKESLSTEKIDRDTLLYLRELEILHHKENSNKMISEIPTLNKLSSASTKGFHFRTCSPSQSKGYR